MPFQSRLAKDLVEGQIGIFPRGMPHQPGSDEETYKAVDIGVAFNQFPVEPACLIILAIGVVVPPLGAAHLVTHMQHWRTDGYEGQRQEVLYLPVAERFDCRIAGGSLDAAVPAQVRVGTVPVLFAVGLVVLALVGNQVVQGKSIVTGDEIDALFGPRSS